MENPAVENLSSHRLGNPAREAGRFSDSIGSGKAMRQFGHSCVGQECLAFPTAIASSSVAVRIREGAWSAPRAAAR